MRVGHADRANPSTARRTEMGLRRTTTSCREHRSDPASPSAHSVGRRTKIAVAEHRPAREGWHRVTPFFRMAFRHRETQCRASARRENCPAQSIADNNPAAFAGESFRMKWRRSRDATRMTGAPPAPIRGFETRKAHRLCSHRTRKLIPRSPSADIRSDKNPQVSSGMSARRRSPRWQNR